MERAAGEMRKRKRNTAEGKVRVKRVGLLHSVYT